MSEDDGVTMLRGVINNAPEIRLEPPRPLMREVAPAHPFPVDALGDTLGRAARAIHDRIQAPMAIAGNSVLATGALAVQGHGDVQLPLTAQIRPLSEYFVTVAASGERKTACDHEASWPIRRREETLREKREADVFAYQNDHAAWEKARDHALKKGQGNRSAMRAELEKVGSEPLPPLAALLTCPEPTFEGLCKLFMVGLPSLGIYSAEGGQFIGGHGMSDEAKLRTAAGLSEMWDGGVIRRVRAGDGATILPGRRLSLHLMAQPEVAEIMFGDRLLLTQGLLSRMLVSAPDSAAGTRLSRDEQPETDRDLKRYGARILERLEAELPLVAPGRVNGLKPRVLQLCQAARQRWIEYADHVELAVGRDGDLEPIRGLAGKLAEHAARLAGILTLADDFAAIEIADEQLEAGIALAEHYGAEALRLFGTSQISTELKHAEKLRKWLLHRWLPEAGQAVSLPDIYQLSIREIRTKAAAARTVAILVEHGYLEPIPEGAEIKGIRRDTAPRGVAHRPCRGSSMTGYRQFPTRFSENRVSPLPPAKVAKVAKDRGGTLATLAALAGVKAQTRNFADDPAWWRDLLEERAAIRQFDGGYTRGEAERLAWEDLEHQRHRLCGERVSGELCAGCLQAIDSTQALTLDDGCRVHLACVARYGRRWREATAAALVSLGLRPPLPPARR